MNVLYTCDNNYIWLMGISVISLYENNKQLKELDVYLLGEKISQSNKELLNEIAGKYDRKVHVIDVPKLKIPDILVSERWPLSAFTRLYSGQLLPKTIKSVLYMDCDTIITDSLDYLDNFELGEKIFWGIKDCIGKTYKENISLRSDEAYINAGVLLINLEQLRKVDVSEVLADYMDRYAKLINYADQDILNGVFSKNIGILPARFNVMTIDTVHSYKEIAVLRKPTNFYSEKEFLEAIKKPAIIHYTTNMNVVRPWFLNTNHPYAHEFKKYMLLSPWSDKKVQNFEFKTKEAKIINMLQKFPKAVAYRILGLLHAELKPIYIRFRATRRFSIKARGKK